jgi:sn-glycerol 3-phosphate transport system substrate-binding protein
MKHSVYSRRSQEEIAQHPITRALSVVAVAALALLGGAAGAQAKTEIYFWHAMPGQLGETVEELAKQFNQSQADFEVKALYKGTYPEVLAATRAANRQKKNPPHIVQISNFDTHSMMMSDMIIPIYRLMQQQKIAVNWADFIETITEDNSKDGRLYSMPFNASTPILYYNKDIFRKAGLGDTPPVTWPAVEAASRKILATGAATCGFTTGSYGYLVLAAFPWHDQPFATNQNGQTGLDTRLLINSDFGLMHVGALARWQKENIFHFGGPVGGQPNPKFINRDCAMVLQSSAFIGEFKKSLTFDWGTGALPHWGPPYPKANAYLIGGTLWALKGRELAADKGVAQFLKFLIEPTQQRWWVSATGFVPVIKSAINSLEDDSFYKQNPEQWTAVSELLNAKPTPNSRGIRLGNFDQVGEIIAFEMENIFTGKKTVKEGLGAAVRRGNAILRQFGVSHGAAGNGEI